MSVHELGDIDKAITAGVQRRNRTRAVAAGVAMTCVAVLAAVILGTGPADTRPEPLQQPTPSPASNVKGWPTSTRNPPGVYSLDPFYSCGGSGPRGGSCNHGWMHNGFGSGDVEIWIAGVHPLDDSMPEWANGESGPGDGGLDEGTPVVVAGHDGFYRRVNDRREVWMVDIDGRPVGIQLTAKPGTSRADLAEAHAIIDSIRTEPSDHQYFSFRLVFTITSNDWDSG